MQDLDIGRLRYDYEPQSVHPYYGFRISARDLARFGQLYLQQGAWEGEQIVPAQWVAESVYPYSRTPDSGTYTLDLGALYALDGEVVGLFGSGSFVHNDGQHQVPGELILGSNAGISLSQSNFNDAWSGDEVGTISWMATFGFSAERWLSQRINWKNGLLMQFGQTHQQNEGREKWLPPQKSSVAV